MTWEFASKTAICESYLFMLRAAFLLNGLKSVKSSFRQLKRIAIGVLVTASASQVGMSADEPEFPPVEKVLEGFVKSESRSPDGQTLGNIWTRDRDAQMFVELPKDFASKRYFVALTISSGDEFAGLQSGDYYVYWRMYNKRLALILPNVETRSNGEPESKASVKRLFTDTVLLDVAIISMVPRGGPLIDGDALFVNQATKFFGPSTRISDPQLTKIVKAKAFSKNIEIAFEVVAQGGQLQTLHYSLSEVPEDNGYHPRKSDERIGYFSTSYTDLGSYDRDKTKTRFINRWRLEKRDPSLKISPPVTPIRFYVEHTTPVRYRRWVKQGIEYWNKAFEKVGFADAVEVYYQDARTGAFMDLDPEDVQYNFVRWLNNNEGTAIGPSRVHPMTGEILDADIILTDGWIRHFNFQFQKMMPDVATEGMSGETMAWLSEHPTWDPRVRFAAPENQQFVASRIAKDALLPWNGHPATKVDGRMIGNEAYDGLLGRVSQINGMCLAARGKQLDIAMARMALDLLAAADEEPVTPAAENPEKKKEETSEGDATKKPEDAKPEDKKPEEKAAEEKAAEEKKAEEKKAENKKADEKAAIAAEEAKKKKAEALKEDMLDGMPESFIGPLLAELVAHEVGHTLGLRHNFKASSAYSIQQINSDELKGKKPLASSVMDYLPVNMTYKAGEIQGDWTMIGIGPYDYWAIEYGYTPDDAKLPELLKRVAEPELQYATDEDTTGPDPLARRYDFSSDPLAYAQNQAEVIKSYRKRLLDKFVSDGDSWSKARRGYELTLVKQMDSLQMVGNWIGGAFVNRDKKGDPQNRQSLVPVDAAVQRKSLEFVYQNAFRDEAFGLTTELMQRLTIDKWWDDGMNVMDDSTFPIHDRILAMQASVLTKLMSPTTLRRVLDNEQMISADKDALVLPELMDGIKEEIWSELGKKPEGEVTTRKPRISSLRRNLQREHMERLIDLVIMDSGNAAMKPISTIAMMQLRDLKRQIDGVIEARVGLDAYSAAHLSEASSRIAKAIDGQFIYNMPKSFGSGLQNILILGQPEPKSENE